ncbi:MAG: homoserine kinase [Gluconacetobacter diazotrophicus]|nr:homoserine kinase [Gluconacetobacter diazotrophicus]
MAVYTDVSDEALGSFLDEYELGGLVAFRGIAEGVENSNFSLRTERGDFILTLYERRVDPAELPWFLGLMRHLAAGGVSCPVPVAGRDGEALRTLAGRPAAITSFLPGVWPRRVRAEHGRPLGEALARLHLAGGDYPFERPNSLGPAAWAPLLDRCRADGDLVRPGLVAELDVALGRILPAWPHALPRGQIHADLFPDNVFFLGPASSPWVSGLIDFYFACTDLLAYDLAVCLNAWCFERAGSAGGSLAFNVTKARRLLAGYESVRPLHAAERDALPVLAQGAALRFLLTRLFDWVNTPTGALVTRKDPMDYLHRLRFHLEAAGAGAFGL